MIAEERTAKLVPALERGVRILNLVAKAKISVTLSDIAREIEIPKSSAHSICQTLLQLGLLIKRPDQTFQIGPHIMRWSNAFLHQSDLATEFTAIWDSETDLPGATITLSVLEGQEVVYLAARNSAASEPLIHFRAGMRLPAPFTATGKAFLSRLSEFEVRLLFKDGLPDPLTNKSVQSLDALLEELRQVRENGYSCDDEQVADGVVCYGSSVIDSRNRAIAGVAVSLPIDKLHDEDLAAIISSVQRIASRLSHRMGAEM